MIHTLATAIVRRRFWLILVISLLTLFLPASCAT